LIGLPSSGIHSNGFSLVRTLLNSVGVSYHETCPFDSSKTFGEVLMEPTVLYAKECCKLFHDNLVDGLAHITGGGLLENIPRVLTSEVACKVDGRSWKKYLPPIFSWIASLKKVPKNDMFRTFNCGIGMVLFVKPENVSAVIRKLQKAVVIGEVVERVGSGEQVLIEGEPW